MFNIITRCPEHGIINSEPVRSRPPENGREEPQDIFHKGNYNPGQMKFCPYCGKSTDIEYPIKREESEFSKKYYCWILDQYFKTYEIFL